MSNRKKEKKKKPVASQAHGFSSLQRVYVFMNSPSQYGFDANAILSASSLFSVVPAAVVFFSRMSVRVELNIRFLEIKTCCVQTKHRFPIRLSE